MPALLSTDVVVFARTANGDLELPLRGATGLEAASIGIRTRLLMIRGEWFLDLDAGVPYLPTEDGVVPEDQAILGQEFDPIKTRAAILDAILDTPGVFDVPWLRLDFNRTTRVLNINWIARTQFGDTEPDSLKRNI